MLVFVLGTGIAIASCGGDDDDNNSGTGGGTTSGGTASGGGTSAKSIVGTYTAVTSAENTITVMFSDNGTGVISEKYKDSYTGKWDTDMESFTYSMAGETGILKKGSDSYSSNKGYIIKFIDGFMLVEESDGDIEFILYKSGQDLGKPNASRFVGTWEYKSAGESVTAVVNNNGTGWFESEYTSGSYHEKETATFTYTARNAYICDCTVKETDSYSGNITYTLPVVLLNDKLYLVESDGEVDSENILTRK